MKKTILFTFMLALASLSQAQSLNAFFNKYADDERFSYAKIGSSMQTLSMDKSSKNTKLADAIADEAIKIAKKENFEPMVESREKGERSYIYTKKGKSEKESEMLIISIEKDEISIVWMRGKGFSKDMLDMVTSFIPSDQDTEIIN